MQQFFHVISLGCAKNTVDSESISQLLVRSGFKAVEKPEAADVVIVNTCGFIAAAREESYQVLSDLAANKADGQLLVAAGCLSQRYGRQVLERIPGIDGLIGTRRWMDIIQLVSQLLAQPHTQPIIHLPENAVTMGRDENGVHCFSVSGASAYLKIADGCHRPCAFCAIPLIKGTTVSRPLESILSEARMLQDMGVRELILIAQDTTAYGWDLGLKNGLVCLLNALVETVPRIDWIRLLYAYPGYVSQELIEIMASQPQVLPYLDIPLQHAHPRTLERMRRPSNIDWVYHTLNKMRQTIPGLALRTTFIVGYPGETEAEFQALLDFIAEMRFDRVGAFTFSFEPGSTSESLGDPIPQQVKHERMERLMTLQQTISLENNQTLVGKTLDVLIEGQGEVEGTGETVAIGRSYRDAPEIDGLVFVDGQAPVAEIVPVQIKVAMPYDLSGTIVANQGQRTE